MLFSSRSYIFFLNNRFNSCSFLTFLYSKSCTCSSGRLTGTVSVLKQTRAGTASGHLSLRARLARQKWCEAVAWFYKFKLNSFHVYLMNIFYKSNTRAKHFISIVLLNSCCFNFFGGVLGLNESTATPDYKCTFSFSFFFSLKGRYCCRTINTYIDDILCGLIINPGFFCASASGSLYSVFVALFPHQQ